MKHYSYFLLALMLVTAMYGSVRADEPKQPIQVVSYYIPLLVEDSEEGAFVKLFNEAAKRADVEYQLTLYPTKRAMRLFEDSKTMAIFPALLPTLTKDAALTCQIFSKQIHAFVKNDSTIPRKPADLEGLRVGLVRGFSYPRAILYNENIMIDFADTTDSSLKKLEDGRVDAVVVDGHTAIRVIEKHGLKGLKYDLSIVLHSQPAFIAFQPTPEGKALAIRFSKALISMKEDGTYERIIPNIY